MIKKAIIQNFQSHKKSVIEFVAGMNVIVGHSDCGKTSILRALTWCIDNKPGGDAFRSTWGGDTSVKLYCDNNIVERSKVKSTNAYRVNDIELKAFGASVPEEVSKTLNMGSLNVQKQLDKPFLITETSGAIASHFNKMANLDIIDKSTSYIQKEINAYNSDITHKKTDLKEKKQAVKELPDIDALETSILTLEKLTEKKKELINNTSIIFDITEDITDIRTDVVRLAEKTSTKKLDKCLELYKKRIAIHTIYEELRALSLRLYYCKKDREAAENIISSELVIDKLLLLYEKRDAARRKSNKLQNTIESILSIKKTRKKTAKQLATLEIEFADSFPDICPLCDVNKNTKYEKKKR